MTLFAVAAAGIFPAIHVGRPWLAYWLFPYPNTMRVWPQFRSPLMWDVFAVSTYATISALFWFIGLIPDFATLRDRTDNRCAEDGLRHALLRMARIGPPLAPLRDDVPAARRTGHAAGALRSHRRQLRLRRRHRPRMAHHHLPALLRRRRHLLRLRHGADAGHSHPQDLRPRRFHHRAPPAELRQGHARHRTDRRLRLRHRGLHGMVQRRSLRRLHPVEPPARPLRRSVLDAC